MYVNISVETPPGPYHLIGAIYGHYYFSFVSIELEKCFPINQIYLYFSYPFLPVVYQRVEHNSTVETTLGMDITNSEILHSSRSGSNMAGFYVHGHLETLSQMYIESFRV